MPTFFQTIQGFAGASGVGVLCLLGLFLIVSAFAENLPIVATHLMGSSSWSAVASLPLLVVAYVIGLLAIALVDGRTGLTAAQIRALKDATIAARYAQIEQEAEILSGSVVGFVLLGIAALLNARLFPGWTRTLVFGSFLSGVIAASAWMISRAMRNKALALIDVTSAPMENAG